MARRSTLFSEAEHKLFWTYYRGPGDSALFKATMKPFKETPKIYQIGDMRFAEIVLMRDLRRGRMLGLSSGNIVEETNNNGTVGQYQRLDTHKSQPYEPFIAQWFDGTECPPYILEALQEGPVHSLEHLITEKVVDPILRGLPEDLDERITISALKGEKMEVLDSLLLNPPTFKQERNWHSGGAWDVITMSLKGYCKMHIDEYMNGDLGFLQTSIAEAIKKYQMMIRLNQDS